MFIIVLFIKVNKSHIVLRQRLNRWKNILLLGCRLTIINVFKCQVIKRHYTIFIIIILGKRPFSSLSLIHMLKGNSAVMDFERFTFVSFIKI